MITKKKLKAELDRVTQSLKEVQSKIKAVEDGLKERDKTIQDLRDDLASQMDTISGKEAAAMLGWSGYISASWLRDNGIVFTQEDNGVLHISRKSMEEHISKQQNKN